MEEYWNPDDPSVVETDEQATADQSVMDDPEPVEEKPKPKKKTKKTFKRRLKRALRRFFKLPLLTRCIALGTVVVILVAMIVLLVVLPKNCKNEAAGAKDLVTESTSPEVEETPTEAIEQISEPTNTPAPTSTPIPTLPSAALKMNDRDAVIPYIRARLVELGYMEMPATNDELYDQATFNAVKRFQYRNFPDNIKDWDGYIGQKTYDKMFSSDVKAFYIKSGDSDTKLYDGELVTKMQRQLIALGYLKTATGTCDKATVDAIRQFQKKNSLTSDGVAGLSTLNLLKQLAADAQASPAATDTMPVPADTAETTDATGTADAPAETTDAGAGA